MDITKELFKMQDLKYKEFNQKLIPTVNSESVIGVRTPELRAFAKMIKETKGAREFLKKLPHRYYEENNLHAFLIEEIKDFDECIGEVEKFLPYIDNWATCDCLRPKCFKKHISELFEKANGWIASEHTYTVRYGIGMLMTHFLDENFKKDCAEKVALIKSDEYYIKMMIAWYFQTALVKQYESAVSYLAENRLDVWVHNKTIQKAVESYRITDEKKRYLKSLKRKA